MAAHIVPAWAACTHRAGQGLQHRPCWLLPATGHRSVGCRRRAPRSRVAAPPRAALLQAAAELAGYPQVADLLHRAAEITASLWAAPAAAPAAGSASGISNHALLLADLATALQPACFDEACGRARDTLLVVSLVLPVLALVAAVSYLLRPPPQESLDDGSVFADESTGTLFEAPGGATPERDRKGELAFRAVSYTPWPVEEGFEGERLRLDVGVVGERQPRTFVFSKVLPEPSQLVMVTLERPLGIVFEEDARKKRAVVAGFAPGGHAEQVMRRAKVNPSLAASAALEGDVLRACTATCIVYPTRELFGLKPPKRAVVVYGADGQRWPQIITALKKGLFADGPVTLVLERPLPREGSATAGWEAGAAKGVRLGL